MGKIALREERFMEAEDKKLIGNRINKEKIWVLGYNSQQQEIILNLKTKHIMNRK